MNHVHTDPHDPGEPDDDHDDLGDAAGFDGVDDRPPSKSMLKRASHELQVLGQRLLAMPDSRLDDIGMPERLRDALADWKKTRSFEGKRRQLQYIGKVIRLVDAEPLREAVAAFEMGHARDALSLHDAERWRAELISDDKTALTRWAQEHPEADLQHVRNLVRNARKDAAAEPEKRSGKAYRELFQHVKKVLHESGASQPDTHPADATEDRHDDAGDDRV